MIRSPVSTFPQHKFDFDDPVFVSDIYSDGPVEGIRHQNGTWHYLVRLATSATWWTEDQLQPACPHCFAPCQQEACAQCGFNLDELL
jgi:hypothetical protein